MHIKEFTGGEFQDTRTLMAKAVEFSRLPKGTDSYKTPLTISKPKNMAMDGALKNVLHGFTNELSYAGAPKFLGYAMLSNISQEALIRAGVETVADEMTRNMFVFRYDGDGESKEDYIKKLEKECERLRLKKIMNKSLCKMGYFGGCLVYIDVGDLDDEELMEPLILDTKTIKKGMVRSLKIIEPVNITPGIYNSDDPLADNYFKPDFWYIQGKAVHASRFLYISKNDAPLLLKSAYNFFGIPDAQLVLDYVAHFVENRESAQELLHKFSLTCFGTDMTQVLQGQSLGDLVKRMKMFNKLKSNNGTFVYDKEREELMQLNTPLGGVSDIVTMSLNLLCAIFRIPKIKLLGEGEGGLNASSKEQMRSFYDYILGLKEKVLRNPLEDVAKLVQLNLGYEPDDNLKVDFPAMWEMDETERAALNKQKADTMVSLINAGVISQEEARQALSLDKESGFSSIDPEEIPENPMQNLEEERFEFEKEQASGNKDNETTKDEQPKSIWDKFGNLFKKQYDEIGIIEDEDIIEDGGIGSGNANHKSDKGTVGGSLPKWASSILAEYEYERDKELSNLDDSESSEYKNTQIHASFQQKKAALMRKVAEIRELKEKNKKVVRVVYIKNGSDKSQSIYQFKTKVPKSMTETQKIQYIKEKYPEYRDKEIVLFAK